MNRFSIKIILSIIIVSVSNISATAQKEIDKQIEIVSDDLTIDRNKNIAKFSGNVHIKQNDITIEAQNVEIYYVDSKIDRISAENHIVIKRDNQTIKGDKALYNMNNKIIEIFDNVSVIKGNNILTGNKITYDINSDKAIILGDKNRVKAILNQDFIDKK